MLLLIQSQSTASGLIGSKAGYVMYIIRIFRQYWGYFERLRERLEDSDSKTTGFIVLLSGA